MNSKSKIGIEKAGLADGGEGQRLERMDVAHRAKEQASGCLKGPQEVACMIRGLLWGGTSFRESLPEPPNCDLSSEESSLFCHVSIFVHRSERSTANT